MFIMVILLCVLTLSSCQPKVDEQSKDILDDEKSNEAKSEGVVVKDTGWREFADQRNIHIGAAVQPQFLEEPDYAKTLIANYNTLTSENHMKWETIHPEQDRYDFTAGDKIVQFAQEHDMDVRGHALVWHIQNPTWLDDGDWTEDELWGILEDHIKTVVGHYKGEIYAWDVVNEMFENDQYRETIWYRNLGPSYIEQAFIWAREADPDVKLYLNDYSVEEINIKSNRMFELAVELLDKGIPLDGVGFQFHVINEQPLDMFSVYNNVKRFNDLGLEVDFTEIDVRIGQPILENDYIVQGEIYRELMALVIGMDKANNFTTWGMTDKYSWIPGFFTGYDESLPFDEFYQGKPAYDEILALLKDQTFMLDYEERINNLANTRSVLKAFDVALLEEAPLVDGDMAVGEYEGTVVHSFMYNQLGTTDTTHESSDISGTWRIGFKGSILYGVVERVDDITVNNHGTNYENDTVEVFYEHGTLFQQLRSVVGEGFEYPSDVYLQQAVWNDEGTMMEFAIEMPEEDLTGLEIGFNIALSDNDSSGSSREVQLYPFYGHNASWSGKDLGTMKFEGDTPRPNSKLRLTPPYDVVRRLAPNTINGIEDEFEWSEGIRMPLGYDQLNAFDQTLPERNDLSMSYNMTHIDGYLYGIIFRDDDVIEEGDRITVAFEVEGQWYIKEIVVGEDVEDDMLTMIWGAKSSVAEFSFKLKEQIELMNYSINTIDSDGGKIVHDLHPHYNYGKSYKEGNYVELEFGK